MAINKRRLWLLIKSNYILFIFTMKLFVRLFMVITAFLFTTGFGKDTPNLAKNSKTISPKSEAITKGINNVSFTIQSPEGVNKDFIIATTIRHVPKVNKDLNMIYVAGIYKQPMNQAAITIPYHYRYRYSLNS